MKILALDQATKTSGYSIWENGELKQFGKFSYDLVDIHQRIHKQVGYVHNLINEYEPDKIVIEDIQMQGMVNNVSTFQALAQLQGALIELFIRLEKQYELIRPNEWRATCNFLKGNDTRRAAQKKIAQEWVRNTFGQVCTQDEADAICIGYAASYTADNEMNWE